MELLEDFHRRVVEKMVHTRNETVRVVRDRLPGRLNAALIGCGAIAEAHVAAYREIGGVDLVACADLQPQRLEAFRTRYAIPAAYLDYRELLDCQSPDVVSICTWPATHSEIACAAAKAGVRGILVEKPMCVDLAEADEMVACAENSGALLIVGHHHRCNPYVEAARRLIHSGALGAPKLVNACCQTALLNNGTHAIDAILYILGDPLPETVWAQAVVDGSATERGLPAEDASLSRIRLPGGITVGLETGCAAAERFCAHVVCTAGQLRLRFDQLDVLRRDGTWRAEPVAGAPGHRRHIEALTQSVRKRESTHVCDARTSRRTHELLIAILASAATRRPLSLPLEKRDWSYGDLLQRLCSR